jgi:hypothetical protein
MWSIVKTIAGAAELAAVVTVMASLASAEVAEAKTESRVPAARATVSPSAPRKPTREQIEREQQRRLDQLRGTVKPSAPPK